MATSPNPAPQHKEGDQGGLPIFRRPPLHHHGHSHAPVIPQAAAPPKPENMFQEGLSAGERVDILGKWLYTQKFAAIAPDQSTADLAKASGVASVRPFWRSEGPRTATIVLASLAAEPASTENVSIAVFQQKPGTTLAAAYKAHKDAQPEPLRLSDIVNDGNFVRLGQAIDQQGVRGNGLGSLSQWSMPTASKT